MTRWSIRALVVTAAVCAAAGATRVAAAQGPDLDAAVTALGEFSRTCAEERGTMWGVSLCGPIALVDPASRAAVLNAPAPSGGFTARGTAFFGRLPDDVMVANTAVEWSRSRWTMVMLPLPSDRFNRLRLLAHECFHRLQPTIGMPMATVLLLHMDDTRARLWLRLELRALVEGVRAGTDSAAWRAARDALLFRAYRQSLFPGADSLESMLEANEGVAEYTGIRFAMGATGESAAAAAAWSLRRFEATPSFVRSFGYGTGPALGLLLDRVAPAWRVSIRSSRSMQAELARALDGPPGAPAEPFVMARAAGYDLTTLMAEERVRAQEQASRVADYRRRLIEGPVLILRQSALGGPFNPNTVVPIGDAGTVYPSRTFEAEWGTLAVREGGALVSPDLSMLRVAAANVPPVAPVVEGPGWTLRLAAGWTVVAGSRSGDWEVVRARRPD